ncbi:ribonuclease H-like domain-containing protein [Phlebopus sp. FC_14]|nr:ribonuclease H-like domain-containing protein [Phlebopus sp. FC_14]
MSAIQPLNAHAGPLVWIDCEMTGLDPKKDKLLEIAVIITNGNLEMVDDGVQFVIQTDKSILDGMGEWCTNQHGKSGLTQASLDSPHTREYVSSSVLRYIKKWIPEQRIGILAGNSVHADRSFLVEEMPEVIDWLHYRIVDVSSIKELCRRWYPAIQIPILSTSGSHRAMDDIKGSIRGSPFLLLPLGATKTMSELAWYRGNIFLPPSPPRT